MVSAGAGAGDDDGCSAVHHFTTLEHGLVAAQISTT